MTITQATAGIWCNRCKTHGDHHSRDHWKAVDGISTALLYEAIERSGISLNDLAQRLGMYRTREARLTGKFKDGGDVTHLRRKMSAEFVDYDFAVRICKAADIDPVDVGV